VTAPAGIPRRYDEGRIITQYRWPEADLREWYRAEAQRRDISMNRLMSIVLDKGRDSLNPTEGM